VGVAAVAATAEAQAAESAAMMAMPDCAHRHALPSDETPASPQDPSAMAGCAVHCFNFAGLAVSAPAVLPGHGTTLEPVRVSDGAPSQMGLPPFRPPRS